jgi:hypothetical protein
MTLEETKRHETKKGGIASMTNKRKDLSLEDYGDSRKSDIAYGELLSQIASEPNPIFNDDEIDEEAQRNFR